MPSIKILHCADLHIGAAVSALGARAESRRYETLITFEKIINTASESGVQLLLIAGDLFNSNNVDSAFTDRVFECFSWIPDTKIVFAAGNHDPINSESPFKKYPLPENVYVLKSGDDCIEFENMGVRVYGRSFKEVYMRGSERFSLSTDDSFINIMCIHGELKADLNSNYNAITSSFIENSGMDYIALGHVHKRTEVLKLGKTHFAYCGCGEGQGFDELQEKGVYLGEISKGECNLQFVPTCKRMYISETVDISGSTASNEIADNILGLLKQKYADSYTENLYKIILTGGVDEQTAISIPEITGRLSEYVYFVKVRDKSEISLNLDAIANEKTLKGFFVKNMLEKINNSSDDEKAQLQYALTLGLRAFSGEVGYDED